jgi:predicted aconitase with swiveling domain
MKKIEIRPIVEGKIEGEAMVSPMSISFLGGIDSATGNITDHENPLFGKSIANKIFVFPESKGSTVGSYVIYGLKVNGVAPAAFVASNAEPIVVAGAILADIILVDQPTEDLLDNIETGDMILIDTTEKYLKIIKKS